MYKFLILLLCTTVYGNPRKCTKDTVSQILKITTYDFAIQLLDRVAQETEGHFVFSPISTWLELMALADGADGRTAIEIRNVARHYMVCSREFVKEIFNEMDRDLSDTIKRRSIFIIDKLMDVKKGFVTDIEKFKAVKVLEGGFGKYEGFAATVNEIINNDTSQVITDVLNDNDFENTVLLMADVASLKVDWRYPFNPVYTRDREPFYADEKVIIGHVKMMYQTGYFKYYKMADVNAEAVELPLKGRTSMILLLPTTGRASDLIFMMRNVRMSSITRVFYSRSKLINLNLPRFNITTHIENTPELLNDMGAKRMFSPQFAEFKKITDHNVYVSMMKNKFTIEVDEKGVSANIVPELVVRGEAPIDMYFNRPFVFLLVDKPTSVILYAGIYSNPSRAE